MGDALIDALVAKLPPAGEVFARPQREAWLRLMRAAIEVVYPFTNVAVLPPVREPTATIEPAPGQAASQASGQPVELPMFLPARGAWHVAIDGLVRAPDGGEASLSAAAGQVLKDYREGAEAGRLDTLIFADGTFPQREVIARGVSLQLVERAA